LVRVGYLSNHRWKRQLLSPKSGAQNPASGKYVSTNTGRKNSTEANETTTKTTHLLRSSVLGGKVINELGASERGFVYLGSAVLAVQNRPTQSVMWEYRDPGNASVRITTGIGTLGSEGNAELDPLGSETLASQPRPHRHLLSIGKCMATQGSDLRRTSHVTWILCPLPVARSAER
jgi:hypothetical protein